MNPLVDEHILFRGVEVDSCSCLCGRVALAGECELQSRRIHIFRPKSVLVLQYVEGFDEDDHEKPDIVPFDRGTVPETKELSAELVQGRVSVGIILGVSFQCVPRRISGVRLVARVMVADSVGQAVSRDVLVRVAPTRDESDYNEKGNLAHDIEKSSHGTPPWFAVVGGRVVLT